MVSTPSTCAALLMRVRMVATPPLSVAVTVTVSAAPTSTVLFVPVDSVNLICGRSTSSDRLLPDDVGRRVSQLAMSWTPSTSAESRATLRIRFIWESRCGLAAAGIGGRCLPLVDDVGRDQDEQVAPLLLPRGVAEQPPDEGQVDEKRDAGLGDANARLGEPGDHDRLAVADEQLRL